MGLMAAVLSHTSSSAACALPNTLTNGQTADATDVLANETALLNCVNGSVSTTGTPAAGQVAKFSGSSTITNAVSGADYAPATSGGALLSGNGIGGFSNVGLGVGLSFSGGVLAATGGGGGSGVAFGNYNVISSVTTSGSQSSVTFSSIPQTYTDLVVVVTGRTTSANGVVNVITQFNGDSGSNYDSQYLQANSTNVAGAQTVSGTFINAGVITAATAPANASGSSHFFVRNYTSTTFFKTVITDGAADGGSGAFYRGIMGGLWKSTAAITSMTVAPSTGNFTDGSVVTLYGIGGNAPNITLTTPMTLISETVTSGSASSVTVSSIPQSYRDLKVVVIGRGTAAAVNTGLVMRLNGDSGTNYEYEITDGNSSSTTSVNALNQTSLPTGWLTAATAPSGATAVSEIDIHNYTSSSFDKPIGYRGGVKGNSAGDYFNRTAHFWYKSTSPVTSLAFTLAAGNFQDGSIVAVYGIGGSTTTSVVPVGSGGTGQTSLPITPQGRLTLTSNTPVMSADATAQTTIYYTPYQGGLVSIFDGVRWNPTPFSQLSYALNSTAHASGALYDVGVYNASGTPALCTAPAWTNSTVRSAPISQVNGLWVNTSNLTCNLSGGTTTTSIAAGQWTYLGTFYATAAGQTGMAMNAAAANGGSNAFLALYNAYNRVQTHGRSGETAGPYSTSSSTRSPLNASTSNRVTVIDGLGQSDVRASAYAHAYSASGGAQPAIGICQNSTNCTPFSNVLTSGGALVSVTAVEQFSAVRGLSYYQIVQASNNNTGTASFYNGGEFVGLEMSIPQLLPFAAFRRRRRSKVSDKLAA